MSSSQQWSCKDDPCVVIMDGGMGTRLAQLWKQRVPSDNVPMGKWWGAHFVETHPELVSHVHDEYITAGSTVILTCTYQVYHRIPAQVRLPEEEEEEEEDQQDVSCFDTEDVVKVCNAAIHVAHTSREKNSSDGGERIRIGGSVGPIGSALPGGREFTGSYQVRCMETVIQFYSPKVNVLLCQPAVDFLAFETLPRLDEALFVLEYVRTLRLTVTQSEERPPMTKKGCHISFVTHDGTHLPCGATIGTMMLGMAPFIRDGTVRAIGFNCSAPAAAEKAALQMLMVRISDFYSSSDAPHISSIPLIWKPNVSDTSSAGDSIADRRASFKQCTINVVERTRTNWAANLASPNFFLFDRIMIGGCCDTTADDIRWLVSLQRANCTFQQ